jgi:hypothetical protein
MPVEKVQLGVSAIKELLNNGYTWLKKDDLGFGSIQEKYQASDVQVSAIRKHPLLKDLETTARIFVIIDDTKENGTKNPAVSVNRPLSEQHLASIPESNKKQSESGNAVLQVNNEDNGRTFAETDADSFSAFANL